MVLIRYIFEYPYNKTEKNVEEELARLEQEYRKEHDEFENDLCFLLPSDLVFEDLEYEY